MNEAISEMLEPYDCQTPMDYKNALKEIVQQIALLGLSRQGFFYKAAFYGGTARSVVLIYLISNLQSHPDEYRNSSTLQI